MGSTLFSFPHKLPAGFEDASVLIFHLADGASAEASPAQPTLSIQHLRPVPLPGADAARPFRPNIVVTRDRTALALPAFVADQRRNVQEMVPKLALLREGPYEAAGLPAREAEFAVSLDAPPIDLIQWQVVTVRQGFGYTFFATTRKDRWADDRPRFAAFIAGWQ